MRRLQPWLLALAWLALWAAPARADVDLGPTTLSGWLEMGGRGVLGDDHSAKFLEYRDPHEGVFGAADFTLQDLDDLHYLHFGGFDMGEKDADYFLEGGRFGHWGISGAYSLLPHNYSNQALSPYLGVDSGKLFLPGAPPADTAGFESLVTSSAVDAKLGFDANEANVGAFYKPNQDTELRAGYRALDRDGRRPDQITFGFSNFVHFPEPVDEHTREGSAELLFARDSYSLGASYTLSYFDNHFRSFQVENPAPFAGGSSLGAIAAAPDNLSHMISLSGSTVLPTPFVSRLAGTIAYGFRRQDESFVALTVNPLSTPAPLPASNLGGDVRPLLANFVFTARPARAFDVTARYRIYDYDNKSNEILFTQTSTTDAGLTAETRRSFAPSFITQNAGVQGAYRITSAAKATLAFNWEHWDRGPEREVRHLDEFSPEARLDYRAGSWARFQTSYVYRTRTGSSYDELAPFDAIEPGVPHSPLTPPIRKFDEADNHSHNLQLLSQFFLRENVDLTLTGDMHLTDWTQGDFGLLSDDRWDVGFELSYHPHPRVEISAYYSYDWIAMLMRSAASGGTAVWRSQEQDTAHTGGIDLTLQLVPERVLFSAGFFIQAGNGRNQTNGTPPDAVDFPEIADTLWAANTSLRYRYDEHLSLIARYRYESYDQHDWQFDGLGVTRLTSNVEGQPLLGTNNDVFLNDGLENYGAHLFSLSVVYHF